MANMISFTDKKHFYLSFRTQGVETERKSWRGIGLDGSMAGKVVLLIKIEVVLWPFLSTVFVLKTTSVQYLQQFMLCVH